MIKNKLIDLKYITNKNENKRINLEEFIEDVLQKLETAQNYGTFVPKEAYRASKILKEFIKFHSFPEIPNDFNINTNYATYNVAYTKYLNQLIENEEIDYTQYFSQSIYQLSDEEYESIQSLLNKLRDKVKSETKLKKEHRDRILKKVNEMQTELDKNMSSFDSFIGKAHDVFKVLKYGREEVVSPLLKETTDLVNAVNNIESKHSGLPDVSNQIEYEGDDIIETETYDINQLENK